MIKYILFLVFYFCIGIISCIVFYIGKQECKKHGCCMHLSFKDNAIDFLYSFFCWPLILSRFIALKIEIDKERKKGRIINSDNIDEFIKEKLEE